MRILILNGPNINLIGKREPSIYGSTPIDEFLDSLKECFPEHVIDTFQSNHEGVLIDKLQESTDVYDGIVFNPGGYSHTSIALADTIRSIKVPVVEVHVSNIFEREAYRHHSFTAEASACSIVGHGLKGYTEAVSFLIGMGKV
ncbi:MAG: type II 3-dehydroquinate dehydratase [Candidatus Limimorpha sp.]